MPRIQRIDVGGEIYHVLNRANARVTIFESDEEYRQFESILEEAVERFDMPLLAYCVMPNHWHLVLAPKEDGAMQKFMSWLTNTHTRRWHVLTKTVGQGHLYQGRYKSFICAQDEHLFTVLRYVERNAKTAHLVSKAEDWRWSSVWRRTFGTNQQQQLLAKWPTEKPNDYLRILNETITKKEEAKLALSEEKSIPFGTEPWIHQTVARYKIDQVLRGVGRPKNGG